jgi:hypothetical protein
MGIKMLSDGYQSQSAAEFAGRRALKEFFDLMSEEEKRK